MDWGRYYKYITQVYDTYYDESSSYPLTVENVLSLDIINTDTSNPLILTVTDNDDATHDIYVPGGGTFSKNFKLLKTIAIHASSTATTYVIGTGKGIDG